MALSTQPYRGARDFYPEDKRLQKYIFGKWRQVVESFGYEEYDAPLLEPLELYTAKSGQELVNEQTYTFTDRGERRVAIRPEMTPSVSRLVAGKRQELAYPLRWYSIPNLWRYERPQRGRLREHWQLNVDLFGVEDQAADMEIIQIMDAILKSFGAKPNMYQIRVNDRRLMDYILREYLGFDAVQSASVANLIDRMHKIPRDQFMTQLDGLCTPGQRDQAVSEQLVDILAAERFTALPANLKEHQLVKDLQAVLEQLQAAGIGNARFDPTLMRGFDYYTGLVYEIFDTHPDNNRSLFGGGRYDGLVGLFGVAPVPTVGFGMGDITLKNFLELHELMPSLLGETLVYAVLVGDVLGPAQKILAQLRRSGVNVAVDISGRELGKQLKTADKKGIPYALIIGRDELDKEQFKLKDLRSGNEEVHGISRIVSIIEDHRRNHSKPDED